MSVKKETVITVQARMGSTRLPGKSLKPVWKEMPLLEMVLRRVRSAAAADRVVLATSSDTNCEPLCAIARSLDCDVIHGSETDVLSRFAQSVRAFKPDGVVRVCADNPFVDPVEVDRLIRMFYTSDCDYAANNTPESGLPDGFGAEIIRAEILVDLDSRAEKKAHREHVTQYVLDHPGEYSIEVLPAPKTRHFSRFKLDIDTADDLAYIRQICERLPADSAPLWTGREIMDACLEEDA